MHTSKLPELSPSIFTIMGTLAHEQQAVNLSQGFPDFDTDPELVQLVAEAMRSGYNQYAPMAGIFPLREAIAEKIVDCYGVNYHPEAEITVTAGATQALFTAISAFVSAGDEVILFRPAYDCYEPAIIANGGIPISIQMQGKEHSIDWEYFRSLLGPKTKMVIINTPHNPSGTVFSKEDMKELERSLKDTNVLLLSDEVYEHIIFDGREHQSAARFPDLRSRSLICASFGKTFHTTGWKMGYCVAPKNLMTEFQKIHEYNVYSVNHPIQRALATYLTDPDHYKSLGSFFQKKRDFFLSGVSNSRFQFTPSEGTYFQLLDYSNITDEDDVSFSRRLTIESKLASIPVSVFNESGEDHHLLRFCFAKKEDTLRKALDILIAI